MWVLPSVFLRRRHRQRESLARHRRPGRLVLVRVCRRGARPPPIGRGELLSGLPHGPCHGLRCRNGGRERRDGEQSPLGRVTYRDGGAVARRQACPASTRRARRCRDRRYRRRARRPTPLCPARGIAATGRRAVGFRCSARKRGGGAPIPRWGPRHARRVGRSGGSRLDRQAARGVASKRRGQRRCVPVAHHAPRRRSRSGNPASGPSFLRAGVRPDAPRARRASGSLLDGAPA